MSEGGFLVWKRQKIDQHRGPPGNFCQVHRPLPNPPKGMKWVQDAQTREWSVEDINVALVKAELVGGCTNEASESSLPEAKMVDHPKVDITAEPESGPLQHWIQDTDTFQGICLRYKLTPTELRQANHGFSGTNLHLAPDPLRIPRTLHSAKVQPFESAMGTSQNKMMQLLKSCPQMSRSEAKCYLELNEWSLKEALANAREDGF